jgi:uncharacterized protein (DUF1330 family)
MSAALLSIVRILNEERFKAYGAGLVGTTERAGGRYLFRGWAKSTTGPRVRAGDRVVAVAYPEEAGARAYAKDPAVLASKPLRAGAAEVWQPVFPCTVGRAPGAELSGVALLALIAKAPRADRFAAFCAGQSGFLLAGRIAWRADGGQEAQLTRIALFAAKDGAEAYPALVAAAGKLPDAEVLLAE